ncbi:hypothetical protein [Nisaea sp.]|uniref:hypothetical protein n=1 Tax=Nisaea sp. TaxID=2024842 RepID=UPI002B2725C9|nr:hypothetical protein [Nisaea sp.]
MKSKPVLLNDGFNNSHFRSKSKRSDVARGFGDYAFLTLSKHPRIVMAKLKGGFPHVAINVPVGAFNGHAFDLCRYNVAMARRTPSSPTGGFLESETNGRYYEDKSLPIAREDADKSALLKRHYPLGTMIEVLVVDELQLPEQTTVSCYSEDDFKIVKNILEKLNVLWSIRLVSPPGEYNRKLKYVNEIQLFIEKAIDDPIWRGNGLEYDKV